MVETVSSVLVALALIGLATYEAFNGDIAMTVFFCTLMALYMLLWKLDYIERRAQRICELLEGENNGEDPETEEDESGMLEKGEIYLVVENGAEVVKLEHVFSGDSDLENPNPTGNEGEGDDGED